MGKHAFLLGVYTNPDYTDAIINQLLSDKTNIYVHVNDLNWADFIPLAKNTRILIMLCSYMILRFFGVVQLCSNQLCVC